MKTKNKKQLLNTLGVFLGGFLVASEFIFIELTGLVILVISAIKAGELKEKSRWTGE